MTTEDERYRTSTQYRLWSYTPSSLLALRTATNRNAADRVREAVRRLQEPRAVSSAETSDAERDRSVSVVPEGEVDCLTVEEELKLVAFYCRQTSQLGDHLKFPGEVKVLPFHHIPRLKDFGNYADLTWGHEGYGNTIHKALLYNQLTHDIPPNRHPENSPLLLHKNRKQLYPTQILRRRHRSHESRRCACFRILAHSSFTLYIRCPTSFPRSRWCDYGSTSSRQRQRARFARRRRTGECSAECG